MISSSGSGTDADKFLARAYHHRAASFASLGRQDLADKDTEKVAQLRRRLAADALS